ncbi:histone-lysine N-methyltransferase ASHR1 isoform X3 [Rhododendron vialii]|uniref:histone-lysine N-methyltransferase ASHR1 isoform X3 n=1 Tax=Rhododendron vialii TaxID=182163 RepID=UPI00265F429F|nr:histone-lysine N-methyltransferase ASHR1 isoform X3 [Rhododendron vialii]
MEDLQGVLSQRGLTVSTLPDKGRCLFSIRNFSPGEVILNEEPFVSVPSRASVDSRCEWCFSTSNLKRCSACQVVLYCGSTCQIIPTTATDNYNLVEALVSHISEIDEKQLVLYAQMANLVNLILELPGIGIKEIAENFSKLACNAHTICDSELRPLGTGLYPVISIINHSCLPNAVLVFEGRLAVVRAVQHIPKGTEVSISYIETAGSTMTRQKALKEQYFFSCSCPRCAKLGQCDDIQESAILEGYRCKDAECSGFLIRDSGDKGFICQHCGLVRGKEEIKKIASEAKLLSEKASKLPSSGYNTEAYVTYKMIEELQLKLCHPFSIDLMRTRETLLKMLMELQDWKEALAYCRSTIPVYQRAYPGFHPLLGLQYYTCGKLEWFEFALFFVYFCLLRMDLYVSPFTNNVLKLFSMPTRSQCPNLWTDFVPCNRDYEHNHENHFYYHLRVIHMKLYLLWIKRLHKVNHR